MRLPSPRTLTRRAGALAARWPLRFAAFALLSLLATWPLLSTAGALNDFRDAHILIQYEDAARRTVAGHGQLPLWSPYYCGGMYALGAPQARFASPPFLLTLLFGAGRAEPLTAFLLLLAGLEGMFRYARARGATALASLAAAPVFGLSGFFACSPYLGWTQFFAFGALPWAVLGARRVARGDLRGGVVAGAAVAFMAGFGGTYAVPIAAVLCAAELLERALARPRPELALSALAAGGLVAGLAAFRLWPVAETLWRAPRLIGGMSGTSGEQLLAGLFGAPPLWGPYSWYLVGALAVPAAVAGLGAGRRSLPLAAMLAGCLWLAAGYSAQPSLFALLRKLPIYSTLRYPDRFLVPAGMLIAALAAVGLSRLMALAGLQRRAPGPGPGAPAGPPPGSWRRWGWAAAGALLLLDVPVLIRNWHLVAAERQLAPPPREHPQDFHQSRGSRWMLAHFAPMGRGSLSCYEGYNVAQSPLLRGDLLAEEYLQDPSAGTVARRRWSPNRLELEVALARPARLLVNQNHHTGWRASLGQVVSHDGLLAVDLPAGRHPLVLRFLPRSGVGGLGATLAAAAAAAAIWRRWRRPRGRREWLAAVGLCLSPVAVAGAAWALIPEPDPPAAVLRAETGEPVIAEAPPAGAARLGARFAHGLVLEAAQGRWAERSGEPVLELELDWRLEGRLPRGYGFFVHLHPEGADRVNADHPLVSGVLSLDEAPPGKLLRDISVIGVARKHRAVRWTVWAGLWHLHGDGSRLPVVDPQGARVEDHRVLVFDGRAPD